MNSFIALATIITALVLSDSIVAQEIDSGDLIEAPYHRLDPHPFAGKYEPRIGAFWLSDNDRLRLDIGARISLHSDTIELGSSSIGIDAGAEFFTWTRLRSAGRFKFPVESVDYDFGLYAAGEVDHVDARLRISHISAHRVDGDIGLLADPDSADVYSREFVDLSLGMNADIYPAFARLYAGGLWLFNVIPDSLGGITPYVGLDGTWEIGSSTHRRNGTFGLHVGAEVRLNTESEVVVESMIRLGFRMGGSDERGVMIEGGWYHGRSPFGPYYHEISSTAFLGFSLLR